MMVNIKDSIQEAIDKIIDTEYRSLLLCIGEKEFGELVCKDDYYDVMKCDALYTLTDKLESICVRLDQEWEKH